MVQFSCECGRQLQAQDEQVGMQVKCPACDRVSVVPRAESIVTGDDLPPQRSDRRRDAVQTERRDERDRWSEDEEPPRRQRHETPEATSGKAIAALVLGIMSVLCLGNILTGLPAVILGILGLKDVDRSRGRLGGKGLAIAGLVTGGLGIFLMVPGVLIGLLLPAVQKVREAAVRMQESNNLKQCGLAMHNFASANRTQLPAAAAFRSPEGKPLLSWRVALLPYLGESNLYHQFKLDEPWDSEHNRKLLPLMPKVYMEPGEQPDGSGLTRYQVLVGPGTLFEEQGERTGKAGEPLFARWNIGNIPDGTSNTIMIAMADQRVPWTKPEDLAYDPKGPLPLFSKRFPGGFNVGLADGSVRFISNKTSERTLRNAITCNDSQPLGADW